MSNKDKDLEKEQGSEKEHHPFLCNPTNNKFKDNRNQWLTRSLFLELNRSEGVTPPYTLKDDDYKGCKSLKKIYMSCEHIPGFEYDFAEEYLGGWEHWQRLQASRELNTHFLKWKEELDIKLKAQALKGIILTAYGDDKNSLQAQRYLADKGYLPQETKRGRPSKEEKARAMKEEALAKEEYAEDLERLGLKVVK